MGKRMRPATLFGPCRTMHVKSMSMIPSSVLMSGISHKLSAKRPKLQPKGLSSCSSRMARNVSLPELFWVWVDR
jgi:hypothetical protein